MLVELIGTDLQIATDAAAGEAISIVPGAAIISVSPTPLGRRYLHASSVIGVPTSRTYRQTLQQISIASSTPSGKVLVALQLHLRCLEQLFRHQGRNIDVGPLLLGSKTRARGATRSFPSADRTQRDA